MILEAQVSIKPGEAPTVYLTFTVDYEGLDALREVLHALRAVLQAAPALSEGEKGGGNV